MHELIFPLDEVLVLAEHAAAAHTNAEPVAGQASGPALLLAADDGIYLLSNGLPQLASASWQPQAHGMRAAYADGFGPGPAVAERAAAVGTDQELLTGLPVSDAVLRRMRVAAVDHDLFTVTLSTTHASVGVGRRPAGGPELPARSSD